MKKKIITFLICLILIVVLVFLSIKLSQKETKDNNLKTIKLADATLT